MDSAGLHDSEISQETETTEVSRPIAQSESVAEDNALEPKATIEGIIAAEKALAEIRLRSFSGRNPELGKMINCHCGLRHRASIKHEVRYAHRWIVVDGVKVYTEELLIAGDTPETMFDRTVEADIQAKQARIILGAPVRKNFSSPRWNPHKNQKMLRYIRIVRNNLPDEYTPEDLDKARKIASISMGFQKKKTYGKHVPRKKKDGGNTDIVSTQA